MEYLDKVVTKNLTQIKTILFTLCISVILFSLFPPPVQEDYVYRLDSTTIENHSHSNEHETSVGLVCEEDENGTKSIVVTIFESVNFNSESYAEKFDYSSFLQNWIAWNILHNMIKLINSIRSHIKETMYAISMLLLLLYSHMGVYPLVCISLSCSTTFFKSRCLYP